MDGAATPCTVIPAAEERWVQEERGEGRREEEFV